MSPSVDEQLRELEAEVRNLDVLPAAAIRSRGRRRGRRQMAALMVAGAVVVTTAGIAATTALERPEQHSAAVGGLDCVLALPDDPAAVHVRVLDGGAPAGTRDLTTRQLRARLFAVVADTTGTSAEKAVGAATLRYGPAAIGDATVLRATVHGEVTLAFDPDRRDDTIDLVLGPAFTRLATTTELNQALVAAGEPSAPPQC